MVHAEAKINTQRTDAQLMLLSGFLIMIGTLVYVVLLNNLILTANLPSTGFDNSNKDVKEFRSLLISEVNYAALDTDQYGKDNGISNDTLLQQHFLNYTTSFGQTITRAYATRGTSVELVVNNVTFNQTEDYLVRLYPEEKPHLFGNMSLIIPMDSQQSNTLEAYRLVWDILTNTTIPVYVAMQDPVNMSNILSLPPNATNATLNGSIIFDRYVDVPDGTVTYDNYSSDVELMGSYLTNQPINVSVSVEPSISSIQVHLVDKTRGSILVTNVNLTAGKANVTIPGQSVAGSYGVLLVDSGTYRGVQPLVISNYTMTMVSNKYYVSPGDSVNLKVSTSINGTPSNTSNQVRTILFKGSSIISEFNATWTGVGSYQTIIPMPTIAGTYSVYSYLATGNYYLGYPEVVGVTSCINIKVLTYSDFYINVITDDIPLPLPGSGFVGLRPYTGGPFMIDMNDLNYFSSKDIWDRSLNFSPPITIHGLRIDEGYLVRRNIKITDAPSVAIYPDSDPWPLASYYSDMNIPYTLLNDSDILGGSLTINNFSVLAIHYNMSLVDVNITRKIVNWTASGGILYAECIGAVTMDAAADAADSNPFNTWNGFIGINGSDVSTIIPGGPYIKLINSSSILNAAPPMPIAGLSSDGASFNQLSQTNNTSGMYGQSGGHPLSGNKGIAFTINETSGAVNPDANIIGYAALANGSQIITDLDGNNKSEYHLAYIESPFGNGSVIYMAGHDLRDRGVQGERIAGEILFSTTLKEQLAVESDKIWVTISYSDGRAKFVDTFGITV